MKKIILCLLLFLAARPLFAQAPPEGIWQGYDGEWKHVSKQLVDALAAEPSLKSYHLLPSVRGDFLFKLGRLAEARAAFEQAAALTRNARERDLLLSRASAAAQSAVTSRAN